MQHSQLCSISVRVPRAAFSNARNPASCRIPATAAAKVFLRGSSVPCVSPGAGGAAAMLTEAPEGGWMKAASEKT